MHALRCDADQAFAELLRLSQSKNVKLATLAERIVAEHGS
jgi:AmiR/NasT family two-component response regulator